MGGRGSGSSLTASGSRTGGSLLNAQQNNPQNIANQAPTPQNTPVNPAGVTALTQMTDDQLANLVKQSRNVDMPNHLADVSSATQNFVYAAGLNGKPEVLDTAAFNKYLQDNNISSSQILSRTVGDANYVVNGTNIRLSPTQITSMIKDSDLNYVGGKRGGSLYGAGTYFDMNGGRNTGYGYGSRKDATCIGVLSKNAKVVDDRTLRTKVAQFQKTHPKTAAAIGHYSTSNMSIYALSMGYNVIKGGSYHNVIDRTALVMRKDDL